MRKNNNAVLERIKKEVIIETNRIRTNPKAYIPILERYLENFDDNILTRPDKNECIETQEGPKAYKEAIEFLKNQKPINEIEFDEEASKVAEEYAKILSNSGEEDKEDESHIEERIATSSQSDANSFMANYYRNRYLCCCSIFHQLMQGLTMQLLSP